MDGFKFDSKEQKKILDSLEKEKFTTKEAVDDQLKEQSKNLQEDWNQKSYREHKQTFIDGYYQKWSKSQQYYKEELEKIDKVDVKSSLTGNFKEQEQPGQSSWFKTKKAEDKKIAEYSSGSIPEGYIHYDINTVREMNALDKYYAYHNDYFKTRNHQREFYNNYVAEGKLPVVRDWKTTYARSMKAHGKIFGALTGTWNGVYARIANFANSFNKDANQLTREQELDQGIRPFFSMTKKVLWFKKQVGLLGTETKAERSDGSEYNKRILREYTSNDTGKRTAIMDELALKLIKFKLTPNMFTNKYMAANMLQMQRYTDMLDAFVTLTQCNPHYLDMKKKDHTNPDLASLIWSRIILMAPIMKCFMKQHATYFGYSKGKNVNSKNDIKKLVSDDDKKDGALASENDYNEFVKNTWEAIKGAYNSTVDYLDESADAKMQPKLKELEQKAAEKRAAKETNNANQQEQKQESEFEFKYDDGTMAAELKAVKDQISANPMVYDLFGSEINQVYDKLHEQMRRLDELGARKTALKDLAQKKSIVGKDNFGIKEFEQIYQDYIEKEKVRIDSETEILKQQIQNYKGTIEFFTSMNLKDKDFKFDIEALPSVKNVLSFEGLNHIFYLKDAYEYNDLFYKTLDQYNFNNFEEYEENGKKVKINDMWTRYNYTLLKRGLDRARFVNKLDDGKVQKDIKDVDKLNNIERRKLSRDKYEEYEKKYKDLEITATEIANLDPDKFAADYNLTKELDVTDEAVIKKYFWLKKVKKICEDIHTKKVGPSDYNTLTKEQKIDILVKGKLIGDYFHTWQGQMEFATSEAYNYIYDTPNMQGNNKIIEGIDKEYRLTTIQDMRDKIEEKIDDIKKKNPDIQKQLDEYRNNPETKDKRLTPELDKYNKLCEINLFLHGMEECNNYQAKSIKLLGKDAYDAYKADLYKDDKKDVLRKMFGADYDQLVENNLAFNNKREKNKYIEKRIDISLGAQERCEAYTKDKATALAKFGIELPKNAKGDVDLITLQFENKNKSNKEKRDALKNYKEKFNNILHKMKTKYSKNGALDDEKILANIKDVLAELDFADSFTSFNHINYEKDPGLILSVFNDEEMDSLGEKEMLVQDFKEYVWMLLAEYGISVWNNYQIESRQEMKMNMAIQDKDSADKIDELKKESKAFSEREKANAKRKRELDAEKSKLTRLVNEEQAKAEKLTFEEMQEKYNKGDKTIEKKYLGTFVAYRVRTKYDQQLEAIEAERAQYVDSLSKLSADATLLNYYKQGALKEIIKKNEKDAVKGESDWITLRKAAKKAVIEKEFERQKLEPSRNYAEELFKYIKSKAGDTEFLNPDKIKEILTAATKTFFFTLSAGARAEAQMRLNLYDKDRTVMNDYFMWKNNQDTNEVLAERCKVFGQDQFVKENATAIKKIMNVIAESNATVNDMQHPRFLDELKENLTVKGINEKQFMFLLRRHTVGISGKAVTKDDANKADLNYQDVDKYLKGEAKENQLIDKDTKNSKFLKVENKADFLLKTAEEVLKIGEALKLENMTEQYILDNFEDCYFEANKLLAFQQLYYGEKESFDMLYNTYGKRETIDKVRSYFDKGHGEAYALFYNAVISVANKYGITEKGGLSFGLSPEEIDILMDEDTKDKEKIAKQNALRERVKTDQEKAKQNVTNSLNDIKSASEETKLARDINSTVKGTLIGVALQDYVQKDGKTIKVIDTYGLKPGETTKENGLEKFYNGYDEAYKQTQVLYDGFQGKEKNPQEVTYTVSNSFQPQMLFMMAPQKSYTSVAGKIENTDVVVNFKNLLSNSKDNIGGNLAVVDAEKCDRVIKMVQELNLDQGKISGGKDAIYDESFFKNQLKNNKNFYEDMVNAMNFCIIYENGMDLFNTSAYSKQINKALTKSDPNSEIHQLWSDKKSMESQCDAIRQQEREFEESIRKLSDEYDEYKITMLRYNATPESVKKNELKIMDLAKKMDNVTKKINETKNDLAMLKQVSSGIFEQFYNASDKLSEQGTTYAKQHNIDLLSGKKLKSLEKAKEIFSDNRTRFMVSTYFDLFSAYLLKNGIKIDGSLVNVNIYDETMEERTRSKLDKETVTRNDALDMGKVISKDARENYDQLFDQKLDYIKSGKYLDEYKSLENKQKMLDGKEAAKPKEIQELFTEIAKRKVKAGDVSTADFVLKNLSEDERFTLRKYGKRQTIMMANQTENDFDALDEMRNTIIFIDYYDRVKNNQTSANINRVLNRFFTQDEWTILSNYKNELDGDDERFFDAQMIFNQANGFIMTRNAELLGAYKQFGEQAKQKKDTSINSVD